MNGAIGINGVTVLSHVEEEVEPEPEHTKFYRSMVEKGVRVLRLAKKAVMCKPAQVFDFI